MGKLYCLIGKSGSGKDTAFGNVMNRKIPSLFPVVTYTTRPRRTNETEGVEYHFVDNEKLAELESEGKVIEKRTYHTVHGDWTYFTCETDISGGNYIMIGTPDVVDRLYEKYGRDEVAVIYLELDDGIRLKRCISRESEQKNPNYSEVCRRYLADEADSYEGRVEKYTCLHRIDSSLLPDEIADQIERIVCNC